MVRLVQREIANQRQQCHEFTSAAYYVLEDQLLIKI